MKLERVVGQAKCGVELDNLPEPPGIFRLIERTGRISESEMYRTFNMGIGLVIVAPESETSRIIRIFRKHRMFAMRIGRVERKPGIRIKGKLLR
jgi:phosphoribosylformylglycinamidine cyclo-ligase